MTVNDRGQFENNYYIEDSYNPPKWTGSPSSYVVYLEVMYRMTLKQNDSKLKDLQKRFEELHKNWKYQL